MSPSRTLDPAGPFVPWWAERPRDGFGARHRLLLAPAIVCFVLQVPAGLWQLARSPQPAILVFLLCAVCASAALLLLPRAPGPLVVTVGVASVVGLLVTNGPPSPLLPLVVAVVAATASGARVWTISVACVSLALAVSGFFVAEDPWRAIRALAATVLLAGAVGAGEWIRVARARVRERREAWVDRRRAAAEEERVRIARELHDVLAHSLSSIAVQAGVGLHLADSDPAAAKQALDVIRSTSTSALDDVRRVLGVLRGEHDSVPIRPEPGLDDLGALTDEARALGVVATLVDTAHPRPAPPVQLAAYRIVQESLTNVGRHAPGASVEVRVALDATGLTASVRDRRPGRRVGRIDAGGSGRGLLGMRERAALLGGSLDLVAHDDGLEVVARIPVERAIGIGAPS